MASKVIKTIFQFRRATAAEWEANKPVVPAAGEPCFVLDKNILKIGDGKTEFHELEPINGVSVKIAADEKSIVMEDSVFKLAGFDAAAVGAQPRKTADGIEWVVPADVSGLEELKTTVSTLSTDVSGLKEDVATVESSVKTLEDIIGVTEEDGNPLLERVATLESGVATLNGEDTVEGSVKKIVKDEINKFATELNETDTIDTFVELIEYVSEHGGDVAAMTADIAGLKDKVGEESVKTQIDTALAECDFASAGKVESLQSLVDEISETYLAEEKARVLMQQVKYEVTSAPAGTLVNYREKEIRVMVPAGTQFEAQQVGATGNSNMYYIAFKAYAPEGAVGFKEGDQGVIEDEYFDFTGDFAGTDRFGRNYSVVWLPVASYKDGVWSYFGEKSSASKYVGWDYIVEWYDANGVVIASDKIRVNLSNESCHDNIKPYYMANTIEGVKVGDTVLDAVDNIVTIPVGAGLKSSDEIEIAEDGSLRIKAMSWDKLMGGESELVFDGGGAV